MEVEAADVDDQAYLDSLATVAEDIPSDSEDDEDYQDEELTGLDYDSHLETVNEVKLLRDVLENLKQRNVQVYEHFVNAVGNEVGCKLSNVFQK